MHDGQNDSCIHSFDDVITLTFFCKQLLSLAEPPGCFNMLVPEAAGAFFAKDMC
jgi:hypothetical protein